MAPEALPPGYRRWITQASVRPFVRSCGLHVHRLESTKAARSQRVSEPCLPVNLSAYRSGTFDPTVARKTLTWGRGATPKNRVLIESYAKKAEMVRLIG